MDVSVVIVNYNTARLTSQCIQSIYRHSFDVRFEIIVVDNASTDDSVATVKSEFPEVHLIVNSQNEGFGKANNIGIERAGGKYLFLLNSDTLLVNNALRLFFDYMEKHNSERKIGALGCIMYDAAMKLNFRNSFFLFPSVTVFIKELIGGPFKASNGKYTSEKRALQENGYFPVDFVVGADIFMPQEVARIIGGFDPDYFMYWEEADMQYRMSQRNLSRRIIAGPEIIHLEGGSSGRDIKNWQRTMEAKSLVTYFRKHTNAGRVFLIKNVLFFTGIKFLFLRRYTLKEHLEYFRFIAAA